MNSVQKKIYKIKIDDYYYNKLCIAFKCIVTAILKKLNKYPENNKVNELKEFLLNVYSSLKTGNSMVYTFKENIIPLNLIFSELKKE